MEFPKVLLITLTLVCAAYAKYSLLPGDKRTVLGKVNTDFSKQTTLPGVYDKLVSGIHDIKIENGNCSTPFFTCSMVTNDDQTMSTVTISGKMSYGLKWITFFSSKNLIPISIIFLTDNIWNDLATGSIQPQYSLPLVIPAKGLHTVTLTCSILTNPIGLVQTPRQLSTGRNNTVFYRVGSKPTVNSVKQNPQIMNLEDRSIALHNVITLTVKKNEDIDFYACNTNVSKTNYWLTHTIDWNTAPSAAKRLISHFFLAFTPLLMLMVVN